MASAASAAAAAAAASAAAGVPWIEDVRVVARVAPSQRSTPPSNDSSLEQISSPNNSSSSDNNHPQQHPQHPQQATNLSGTFKAFPQQQPPHDLSPENQTKVSNESPHKKSPSKLHWISKTIRCPNPSLPPIRSSVLRTASPSANGGCTVATDSEGRSADKWHGNGVEMKGKGERRGAIEIALLTPFFFFFPRGEECRVTQKPGSRRASGEHFCSCHYLGPAPISRRITVALPSIRSLF